jgi:putative ABC transport system permease protein
MQDEMDLHLEQAVERLVARGMTADAAREAARREFGNVAHLQQQVREVRAGQWIDSTSADVRFGLRHLARTPFSTATMVVLLALAIGFDSAMFTVLYSMTHMPPAAVTRDPSLVRIRGIDRSVRAGTNPGREISYLEYRAYAEQAHLFSAVTAWSGSVVLIDVGQRMPNLQSGTATYVSDNYFRVLDVRLPLGVMPAAPPAEPSPPQLVAVISHALWERYFDRAADVIGKTVKVGEQAVTISGVAPPRFSGTAMGGSQLRLWLPLSARSVMHPGASATAFTSYDSTFLGVAARLRPGVSLEQALPTVQGIAARTTTERARSLSADLAPLLATNHAPPTQRDAPVDGRWIMFAMLAILLLIPCTNVSALLVGQAIARRREIVVRLAMGAARGRIVRQLLTESVLLAVAAGALGLWIIWIALEVFGSRIPDLQIALHWPVLGFTFGFAIVVGILFGLSPSLHATRVGVAEVLKDSGGAVLSPRSRLQAGLVVAQVAFTQPLLIMLGTLIIELTSDVERVPAPAFNDRILEIRFADGMRADEQRDAAIRGLAERFASVPGVVAAVPQQSFDADMAVSVHPSDRIPGRGYPERFSVRMHAASRGYFEVFEIPIVRGRTFGEARTEDPGAVIIGGDLARQLWGSADPIGRRLVNAGDRGPASGLVVVGVVDESRAGLAGDDRRIFVSDRGSAGHVLVRTHGHADAMASVLRSIADVEAPGLRMTSARSLAAIAAGERATLRRAKTAAITTGVIALVIAAIGLYAVVAFAVGQRTREVGIRSALGAKPQQVVRMFLVRGMRLSVIGLVIGLGLTFVAMRVSTAARGEPLPDGALLLGVAVALVVVGVAALATWIPARRAAAIDPLGALRAD